MKSKLLHLFIGTSYIASIIYLCIIANLSDQEILTLEEAGLRVAVVMIVLVINVILLPFAQKERAQDGSPKALNK